MPSPASGSSSGVQLPDQLGTESELDEFLTEPTPALIRDIRSFRSPLVIVGAGGKMGPSLAVLARRAAEAAGHPLEIIAASRFTNPAARSWLEQRGIRTIAADLLDPASLTALPDSENVMYLVGLKFGTAQNPSATWAMNTLAPWHLVQRYPKARIVALSTGNVYPLSAVSLGGSKESDPLTPLGEYPNAAVARERIFEFASRHLGTRITLLRLFYAVELRYGVVSDIARILHRREPLPLTNGAFNCIWQRDANELALRSLALADSPPSVWNLCQPTVFSVRDIATQLAQWLGVEPRFVGSEAPTALLGNATPLCSRLGQHSVPMDSILRWTAHWVKNDGLNWNRPTHFEVRDGHY
jgi:nucleoside-diphosphate-sugar epimerase